MSIIASLPVLALLASAAAASHTPHTLINHVIDVLWPAGLPSMPVAVVIGDFTGELKEALSSRAVHVVPMHYPPYQFNEAVIQRRMEAFTEVLEEQPRIRAPTAASLLLCLDFGGFSRTRHPLLCHTWRGPPSSWPPFSWRKQSINMDSTI